MNHLTTLTAIVTLATCTFAVARAEPVPDSRSETVQFADLDTTNIRGVTVLYQRIKSAAEHVCRELEPGREPSRIPLHNRCVHGAVDHALMKVDLPTLTAYATAHGALRGKDTISIARNN